MNVGQAIKTIRQEYNITQIELGERCEMSNTAVSMLERGKRFPPSATVEKVCHALRVPVAYLLLASIEEEDFPESKRILYRTQLLPLCKELLNA